MDLIQIKDVTVVSDSKTVLNNYNFTLKKGAKIHLTGKSGIGKSTIFRILLGFQEYESGSIYFEEELLKAGDFSDVRNKIAYVNQTPSFRPGVVKDVLEELKTFKNNVFEGIDDSLFTLFEFDKGLLSQATTELSGGEKQRLAIMIAISLGREIYFLDEITSALDSELKEKVIQYFDSMDATVLLISHDNDWSSSTFEEVAF